MSLESELPKLTAAIIRLAEAVEGKQMMLPLFPATATTPPPVEQNSAQTEPKKGKSARKSAQPAEPAPETPPPAEITFSAEFSSPEYTVTTGDGAVTITRYTPDPEPPAETTAEDDVVVVSEPTPEVAPEVTQSGLDISDAAAVLAFREGLRTSVREYRRINAHMIAARKIDHQAIFMDALARFGTASITDCPAERLEELKAVIESVCQPID